MIINSLLTVMGIGVLFSGIGIVMGAGGNPRGAAVFAVGHTLAWPAFFILLAIHLSRT